MFRYGSSKCKIVVCDKNMCRWKSKGYGQDAGLSIQREAKDR